jgi:hypothetical protein
MQVQNIDEVGLELLERVANTHEQAALVVSAVVGCLALAQIIALVVGL